MPPFVLKVRGERTGAGLVDWVDRVDLMDLVDPVGAARSVLKVCQGRGIEYFETFFILNVSIKVSQIIAGGYAASGLRANSRQVLFQTAAASCSGSVCRSSAISIRTERTKAGSLRRVTRLSGSGVR